MDQHPDIRAPTQEFYPGTAAVAQFQEVDSHAQYHAAPADSPPFINDNRGAEVMENAMWRSGVDSGGDWKMTDESNEYIFHIVRSIFTCTYVNTYCAGIHMSTTRI